MKGTNSLSHTSYRCKYHIVIVPRYRRMIIYNRLRRDIIYNCWTMSKQIIFTSNLHLMKLRKNMISMGVSIHVF